MKYQLSPNLNTNINDCLIIGLFSDKKTTDNATNDYIKKHSRLITQLSHYLNAPGDMAWQSEVDGHRLLLIDCGITENWTLEAFTLCLTELTQELKRKKVSQVTLCLPLCLELSPSQQVQKIILHWAYDYYQFLEFKTKKSPHPLQELTICQSNTTLTELKEAQAIADGMMMARTLANLPANICTPTYLATEAKQLMQLSSNVNVTCLGLEEIKKLNMGALIAVAQGSIQPPQFIEINYQGGSPEEPPIVLVGKGITFDSGGLSLKPPESMTEMKYDMSGAAVVLGTLKACILLKLPINVVGLIASAENMISGSAVKPGDVVTSMSGQTIEIINTDAEGRLVLADALTYAERFNPRLVIDLATLTGGVIVALGYITTGFMTPDEETAQLIQDCAKISHEKVWRLPLDKAYQKALDSPVADMLNATFDRTSSSITAACFLSRFTQKYRWAHFDIAGTAYISGKERNATGRPIPLLIELLRHENQTR